MSQQQVNPFGQQQMQQRTPFRYQHTQNLNTFHQLPAIPVPAPTQVISSSPPDELYEQSQKGHAQKQNKGESDHKQSGEGSTSRSDGMKQEKEGQPGTSSSRNRAMEEIVDTLQTMNRTLEEYMRGMKPLTGSTSGVHNEELNDKSSSDVTDGDAGGAATSSTFKDTQTGAASSNKHGEKDQWKAGLNVVTKRGKSSTNTKALTKMFVGDFKMKHKILPSVAVGMDPYLRALVGAADALAQIGECYGRLLMKKDENGDSVAVCCCCLPDAVTKYFGW